MITMFKNEKAITSLEEWKEHAPPKSKERHWVDGRSAKELARAWCSATGICPPTEFAALLESHEDFSGISLETGYPEARSPFDHYRGEPRNADLNIVARSGPRCIAISVEGKADESFGTSVKATLAAAARRRASGKSTNADARLNQLLKAVLPATVFASKQKAGLRYQLLTGVAGVLAWAGRLPADAALFVVHEFLNGRRTDGGPATTAINVARNAKALDSFVSLLAGTTISLSPGVIVGPFHVAGNATIPGQIPLYIGKARRHLGPGSGAQLRPAEEVPEWSSS